MRLYEFNQNRLINDFGKKLLSKYESEFGNNTWSSEELIQEISKLDPTPTKELTLWCIARYALPNGYNSEKLPHLKQPIQRFEDIASRAIPDLLEYKALLKKKNLNPPLQKRDINQISGLSELHHLLQQYDDSVKMSNKDAADAEEQKLYKEGKAKLIYNGSDLKVVEVNSKEAAIYFGKGTQWCTASTKSQNMADYYLKKGNLYVVMIKGNNEKYQFHFQDEQFMDSEDEPINVMGLAAKYPVLWDIFSPIAKKNKSIILNKNASKSEQFLALQQDSTNIRYIPNPSEEIQLFAVGDNGYGNGYDIQYIKNPTERVKMAAVKDNGNAIRFVENPNIEMMKTAVEDHAGSIKYIKNPPTEIQWIAVKQNPYLVKDIKNITDSKVIAYANEEMKGNREAYTSPGEMYLKRKHL